MAYKSPYTVHLELNTQSKFNSVDFMANYGIKTHSKFMLKQFLNLAY